MSHKNRVTQDATHCARCDESIFAATYANRIFSPPTELGDLATLARNARLKQQHERMRRIAFCCDKSAAVATNRDLLRRIAARCDELANVPGPRPRSSFPILNPGP
jgi:hypothetical protein